MQGFFAGLVIGNRFNIDYFRLTTSLLLDHHEVTHESIRRLQRRFPGGRQTVTGQCAEQQHASRIVHDIDQLLSHPRAHADIFQVFRGGSLPVDRQHDAFSGWNTLGSQFALVFFSQVFGCKTADLPRPALSIIQTRQLFYRSQHVISDAS